MSDLSLSRGGVVLRCVREIVVVVAAALLVIVGSKYLLPHAPEGGTSARTPTVSTKPAPAIGMTIDVPLSPDFTRGHPQSSPITLLLLVSPDCRFCKESEAFYRILSREATKNMVPLVVSVPSSVAAQNWLKGAGLQAAPVVTWSDINVAVTGTPTLIATDSERRVRRIWRGWLNPIRQKAIISLLADPSLLDSRPDVTITGDANLSTPEVHELKKRAIPHTVLDIRERAEFAVDHHSGAINIPLIELPTRSVHELDPGKLTIIDCSHLLVQGQCQTAIERLVHQGFSRIAALNDGLAETNTCKMTETL